MYKITINTRSGVTQTYSEDHRRRIIRRKKTDDAFVRFNTFVITNITNMIIIIIVILRSHPSLRVNFFICVFIYFKYFIPLALKPPKPNLSTRSVYTKNTTVLPYCCTYTHAHVFVSL